VFCPRCGAPNDEGDRFCAACGTILPGAGPAAEEKRSAGERALAVLGGTQRARIVTVATVLALAIAGGAFIALKPDDEEAVTIPRDAYTIAADNLCVQAKKQIAVSEQRSVADASKASANPGAFAQALVPIIIKWRTELNALQAPADRGELANSLDAALREVEVEMATLARVAQEGEEKATVARAKQVDEVTTRVEAAVAGLGLTKCARITLGVAPAASS